MTKTELAELERKLAQGPHLVSDAVFGACVGGLVGWFGTAHGKGMFEHVAQGACAGAFVSLVTYGFNHWKASQETKPARYLTGAISPYSLYRSSLTYPWSAR